MFSLSKIKNKKSFFLPIMVLFACSTQCYGMEEIVKAIESALGSEKNPIHITYSQQKNNESSQENSLYYKIGWTLLPIVAGAIINFAHNKYNEDSELINLNKEEKRIELELKKHPDYPAITLLHQKNEQESKSNQNQQARLAMELQTAQLLEHHQEKSSHFLLCANNGTSQIERDYCKDMHTRHATLIKQLIPTQ